MPVIESSSYTPPLLCKSPHVQSIFPVFCRPIERIAYTRERLDTPDGDFLDLDWSPVDSQNLVLAIHGLEGSSRSRYMHGLVRAFNRRGWDGAALNLRGCSGEVNRLPRFYHAGATEDVAHVIEHIQRTRAYRAIALVGFSMGGNLVLKYLGEQASALAEPIRAAAAVSTPCDLASSASKLARPQSFLYMNRFILAFRRKIRAKKRVMPGRIDDRGFHKIRTFKQYDDRYTAPLNGFQDAEDYWAKNSAKPLLAHITIPTLMISALDDPMLAPASFPLEEARRNPRLFLELPRHGGHSGFIQFDASGEYWHETRIAEFVLAHSDRMRRQPC
jgi:uncharacterized protein